MPYRWLLFDADDTLFDYQIAEEKSLQHAFELIHIPFKKEIAETYRNINHDYWAQFEAGKIQLTDLRYRRFSDLFAHYALAADPVSFSEIYLDGLGLVADLNPDVLDIVTRLSTTHQMAIITNGITQVQYSRLSLSPIQTFFKHVFISEEIGISKPAAGFFDFVFQTIGNPPKEVVLVIGDSLSSDMTGGINYGLDTCWYNPRRIKNPNRLPITYEIQSITQVPDIVA
jgi:YjjG family noncanonical pyrimidine nucleotidase